jgi:drug/metabolite transporter (DMT)-like permease
VLSIVRPRLTAFDAVLYAGLVLSWGFSWLGVHYQIGVVAPEVSLVWRFAIAAPLMLAIAAMRGESLRFGLRDHGVFVLFGLFFFSMNFLLFYYGNYYLASGLFAVIFSLTSIINVGLARWCCACQSIDASSAAHCWALVASRQCSIPSS